jgi:hypothetical protein
MSDSLNATVMVSEFALTISANPEELELLEDEPPRLPAVVPAPVVPDEPVELDDELDEDPVEEPPETVSPGDRLESEAITPLVGAYSLVALSAVSAVWTAASALYTEPWAEARLPGDGVLVVVVVFVAFAALELPLPDPFEEPEEPDPDPEEPVPLPRLPEPEPEDVDVVVVWVELGPIVVTVLIVVIVVVVPALPDFGFLDLVELDEVGLNEAYSTVPELAPVRLVSLAVPVLALSPVEPDPDEPDPDELDPPEPQSEVSPWRQARLSSAAVRFSLA